MKKQKGFTLTEIMIVVTVVGIISMIAIPSYNSYSRKAKRSDAQQLMMDISSRQTQFLLNARQYTANPGTGGLSTTKDGWTCDTDSCDNNFYAVTIAVDNSATPPTFTITGTAINSQLLDGNLTLTSTGARTLAGNSGW